MLHSRRRAAAALSLILTSTFALALAAGPSPVAAAEGPGGSSPGVEGLAWVTGSWAGSVGADTVEETWLAPAGDAMVGIFRWLKGGEVFLYELMRIGVAETGDGVVLEIKHFGPDLAGWEEKDEAVVFDLVETGDEHAVFAERGDGEERTRLVYRRAGEGALTVTFDETRDGEPVEIVFRYQRR